MFSDNIFAILDSAVLNCNSVDVLMYRFFTKYFFANRNNSMYGVFK